MESEYSLGVVYLAGGMRTGWQDIVKRQLPGPVYLDPRTHGLSNPAEYVTWDLQAVGTSDIIFAYMEADNPSGIGMAAEIGYAAAIRDVVSNIPGVSKPRAVILVCEVEDRYFDFIKALADYVTDSLKDGIEMLAHTLANMKKWGGQGIVPEPKFFQLKDLFNNEQEEDLPF